MMYESWPVMRQCEVIFHWRFEYKHTNIIHKHNQRWGDERNERMAYNII